MQEGFDSQPHGSCMGKDGEEVAVYCFKCDNFGDISTREEKNGSQIMSAWCPDKLITDSLFFA
jgi:hypothetical protein